MTIYVDDRHLVEAHRSGDGEAFEDIVRAHRAALLGHALRKLHDRAAAEDAVQETFVRAYRALPRFEGDYRLGPWLHRILANVCVDEANRRRRESEKYERIGSDPFTSDLEPGVEDLLGLDVDDAGLASALSELPPNYREALELRFVEDLPYDEVARVAGVSEQNARARVSRARTAARAALRGVAAVPVLVAGSLRRGERSAAAAESSGAAKVGAGAGSHHVSQISHQVSQAATAFGPAAEVAMAAAPAAPLVTKTAIGIGMVVAVAIPTAGPAIVDRVSPREPAGAVVEEDVAAPTTNPGDPVEVTPTAPPSTAAAPVAPPVGDEAAAAEGAAAAPPTTDASAPAATPASTTPTTAVPVAPLPAGPAPSPAPAADGSESVPPPPSTVPAPVVRHDGTVSASPLAITPAGPRIDLSGPVSVTADGASHVGGLSGRMELPAGEGAQARRITATFTLELDGEVVTLRLAGHATPTAVPEGGEPTSFSLAGQFVSDSSEVVALALDGTMSGTLDTEAGTLSLSLAD